MKILKISDEYVKKNGIVIDLQGEGRFVLLSQEVIWDEKKKVARVYGKYIDEYGEEYTNSCLVFVPRIFFRRFITGDRLLKSRWKDFIAGVLEDQI